MPEACAACGETLVPGPPGEWSAKHGQFLVTLRNVPFLVCPAGCPGRKAPVSLLLKHVFLLSRGMSSSVARKKGLFRSRAACPRCGQELMDTRSRRTFQFEEPDAEGTPLHLEVEGPALDCRICGASFLSPFGSERGIGDLTGAIAEALTKGESGA